MRRSCVKMSGLVKSLTKMVTRGLRTTKAAIFVEFRLKFFYIGVIVYPLSTMTLKEQLSNPYSSILS